jgi:hypothetical protein
MISIFIPTDTGAQITAATRDLERFGEATKDFRPYWPAVTTAVREIISHTFEYEGSDSAGGVWPRLEPKYARYKFRQVGYNKILVFSGALKASLLGGPGGSVSGTQNRLRFLSEIHYGLFHQTGNTVNKKKRSPWSPTNQDAGRIGSILTREIRKVKLSTLRWK